MEFGSIKQIVNGHLSTSQKLSYSLAWASVSAQEMPRCAAGQGWWLLADLYEEAYIASDCTVPGSGQSSPSLASTSTKNHTHQIHSKENKKLKLKRGGRKKRYFFGFPKWANAEVWLNYTLYLLWCIIRIVITFTVSRKRFFPGTRSKQKLKNIGIQCKELSNR